MKKAASVLLIGALVLAAAALVGVRGPDMGSLWAAAAAWALAGGLFALTAYGERIALQRGQKDNAPR
jgi:hypothetical protein